MKSREYSSLGMSTIKLYLSRVWRNHAAADSMSFMSEVVDPLSTILPPFFFRDSERFSHHINREKQ